MTNLEGEVVGKIIEGGSTVFIVLKWFAIIAGITLICGGIFWMWVNRKRYFYINEVWGSDGGIPDVLQTDKARPIKVRTKEGVSSLLYHKKLKKYWKMPLRTFFRGKKIRSWFRPDGELTAVKPVKVHLFEGYPKPIDGEKAEKIMKQAEKDSKLFIPLVMEDINEKFAVLQVRMIDEDMRLAHTSTAKIVRDMFNVNKFFKEHGATILMIIGVLVMAISLILIIDGAKEYYKGGGDINEGLKTTAESIKKVNEGLVTAVEELKKINAVKPGSTQTIINQPIAGQSTSG